MTPPRLIRPADPEALRAAVCAVVHEALPSVPGRFVALAVGESTLGLYAGLDPEADGWGGRIIVPVDELVPPPADPARRFGVRLAAALPAGLRDRVAPLDVSGDPERRAAELDARLHAEGVAVAVLGLGPDGHIAFNQPPTPAQAGARVLELLPANLERLEGVAPARAALTMGVANLVAAAAVVVVAEGPGKAMALDRLLHGPAEAAWPVTWLRSHPRLTIAVGPGLS